MNALVIFFMPVVSSIALRSIRYKFSSFISYFFDTNVIIFFRHWILLPVWWFHLVLDLKFVSFTILLFLQFNNIYWIVRWTGWIGFRTNWRMSECHRGWKFSSRSRSWDSKSWSNSFFCPLADLQQCEKTQDFLLSYFDWHFLNPFCFLKVWNLQDQIDSLTNLTGVACKNAPPNTPACLV